MIKILAWTSRFPNQSINCTYWISKSWIFKSELQITDESSFFAWNKMLRYRNHLPIQVRIVSKFCCTTSISAAHTGLSGRSRAGLTYVHDRWAGDGEASKKTKGTMNRICYDSDSCYSCGCFVTFDLCNTYKTSSFKNFPVIPTRLSIDRTWPLCFCVIMYNLLPFSFQTMQNCSIWWRECTDFPQKMMSGT